MLREGQQNGKGYAPRPVGTHLAAVVVGLRRERGVSVSGPGVDQAEARTGLTGLEVKLLHAGGAPQPRKS
ncbi:MULTISPECIES: hypothetical protein [unclassified Streptomyces]|uniref:hypothetical protein n=1 Tax=unclassified Streptomyces TaxID=2593676 RepID=UPI00288673B2|nr:hypothetical protein [Streptomyces sp. DSM 41633]